MLNIQDENGEKSRNHSVDRCPMCATVLQVIWVHGHGQCAKCGFNVEPCCSGAPLAD
jgi:hypothetical protein